MFVIARYVDGPSYGLDDEPRDFTAWGWGRPPADAMEAIFAMSDPEMAIARLYEWGADNRWPRHRTMREAIDAALASEEGV